MSENGPQATYDIAIGYITGVGRPQDYAEGAKYMKIAADEGYMPAIRDLGVLYVNGNGVEKDPKKGYDLLMTAVKEMDPRAMYHAALLYRHGIGVGKDLYEALRLMGFAAGMKITGAEQDAEEIEAEIDEQRRKNLCARPILKLEISDVDIEACCCKEMFDAALSKEVYLVQSYKGPVLMTEDEEGEEVLLPKCPFCGASPITVPRDKVY